MALFGQWWRWGGGATKISVSQLPSIFGNASNYATIMGIYKSSRTNSAMANALPGYISSYKSNSVLGQRTSVSAIMSALEEARRQEILRSPAYLAKKKQLDTLYASLNKIPGWDWKAWDVQNNYAQAWPADQRGTRRAMGGSQLKTSLAASIQKPAASIAEYDAKIRQVQSYIDAVKKHKPPAPPKPKVVTPVKKPVVAPVVKPAVKPTVKKVPAPLKPTVKKPSKKCGRRPKHDYCRQNDGSTVRKICENGKWVCPPDTTKKPVTMAEKYAALQRRARGYETREAEHRGYQRAREEFRKRRGWWKKRHKGVVPKAPPKPGAPPLKPTAKPAAAKPTAKPKPAPVKKAIVCKGGLRKRGDKCVPPPRPRWRCPRGKKPNFPSNWYDPAAQKRYADKYKDVAAAVRGGSIRSGLFHYACTGSREGRTWSGYSRPGYLNGIFANWDQDD